MNKKKIEKNLQIKLSTIWSAVTPRVLSVEISYANIGAILLPRSVSIIT